MHSVLGNRLGGARLPRNSLVRLTDRPDMTIAIFRGRKATKQQQLLSAVSKFFDVMKMTYSRRLILAVMNSMFPENKNVMLIFYISSYFSITIYIVASIRIA